MLLEILIQHLKIHFSVLKTIIPERLRINEDFSLGEC